MALLNPTFADAGALPGEAAHWTLTAVTSREVLAAFGGVAREDFEGWGELLASLTDVTVVRVFFGSDGFEAFERLFLYELPTGRLVTFPFSGGVVETWTASPLLDDWAAVPSVSGLVEDFARAGFAFDWVNVASAGLPPETFSGTWTHAVTL